MQNSKNKDEFEKTGIPTVYSGTFYLSRLVWKAIGEIIISARECMIWLQKVSKLISDNQLPVTWTTPTGFIVQMNYRKMKKQRVNTRMGESMLTKKVTIQHETDKIDFKSGYESRRINITYLFGTRLRQKIN